MKGCGMNRERWFRVTFVRPDGWTYEMTGRASIEVDAVRLADEFLEHVERIGISDFLADDGLTVQPPASLQVETVDVQHAGSGLGLVITDPHGNVTRK